MILDSDVLAGENHRTIHVYNAYLPVRYFPRVEGSGLWAEGRHCTSHSCEACPSAYFPRTLDSHLLTEAKHKIKTLGCAPANCLKTLDSGFLTEGSSQGKHKNKAPKLPSSYLRVLFFTIPTYDAYPSSIFRGH